jgi:hypothetical protein
MKIITTTAEVFFQREGVMSKPIRKPENLPECLVVLPARTWADQHNVDKFGSHIRTILVWVFYWKMLAERGSQPFVPHGTNGRGNR